MFTKVFREYRIYLVFTLLWLLGYMSANIANAAFLAQFQNNPSTFLICTNSRVKTNNAVSQWWNEQPAVPNGGPTGTAEVTIQWWAPNGSWWNLSEKDFAFASGTSGYISQFEDIAGFNSLEWWAISGWHALSNRQGGNLGFQTGWFYKQC